MILILMAVGAAYKFYLSISFFYTHCDTYSNVSGMDKTEKLKGSDMREV